MNLFRLSILLALVCAPLPAQTAAAPAPASSSPQVRDGEFSYHLPDDWQIIGPKPPMPPSQQKKEEQQTSSAEAKKGIACVEIAMTARHGEPPTAIDIVTLPFDCYGETMTEDDLPGFVAGAADGLKQNFAISDPLTASYSLAGHRMWVERARAVLQGKTAPVYTLEIACTLLKKEAVCWLAQAADEASLRIFESAPVTLDGDAFPALMPAGTFLHLP